MAKVFSGPAGRVGVIALGALALGGGLGAFAFSPSGRPAASAATTGSGEITVSATGTTSAASDQMTLTIGVSHTGASAAGALATANLETARMQQVFLSNGVARRDLQTSDLQLNPNYDSAGHITGYDASDQLNVTLTDLARAGTIIDAAARAVGNDVTMEGVSFSVANRAPLLAAARAAAMRNAAASARELAAAAGERLGSVVSITAHGASVPPPVVLPFRAAAAASSSAVPVQGGTSTVSASVTVVYALLR